MSTENRENIPDIGERLKKERQRLCLSQEALCKLIGIKDPKTLRSWESGTTAPTLFDLAEFASKGADLVFIITGHRQPYLAEEDLRDTYLTPARRLAGDIAGMNHLSSDDAELLLALAKRLHPPG